MKGLISDAELQELDLIDLLSERHSLIRRITEKAWNDQSDIRFRTLSGTSWLGFIKSNRPFRM